MSADARTGVGPAPLRAHDLPRPPTPRLVIALTGHSLRAFARNPVAAFFTLVFPLAFLALVSAVVGNEVVPDGSGVRIAQLLVAPFAAFGVAYAAFCVVATDTAQLREKGVLKRWRGSPAPPWTVIASRIAAAVVIAALAVAILTAVGVIAYGVEIQWPKTPALLVTLLTGIACLAALGLALAALTRSSTAAQAASNGILIPLAFISDIFLIDVELPAWLDRVGSALPLKHFVAALRDTFDPAVAGSGFALDHLAMLTAWAAAAALVAWRMLGWEPGRREHRKPTGWSGLPQNAEPAAVHPPPASLRVRSAERPPGLALLRGQVAFALTAQRRDLLPVFFAVVFPTLLLLLFPYVYGADGEVRGLTIPQFMLPAMVAWAVGMGAYVNVPNAMARSRERGVHKRLRGTPLPWHWYLAGQLTSAAVVAATATALLFAVAIGVGDAQVRPAQLPAIIATFLVGLTCMAAIGFAVFTLIRSAKTLGVVTIGTLLPLAFLSDIFLIGPQDMLPRGLTLVSDIFPLKHLVHAMLSATRPDEGGAGFAWGHLAVLVIWTLAAVAVVLAARARPRLTGER